MSLRNSVSSGLVLLLVSRSCRRIVGGFAHGLGGRCSGVPWLIGRGLGEEGYGLCGQPAYEALSKGEGRKVRRTCNEVSGHQGETT